MSHHPRQPINLAGSARKLSLPLCPLHCLSVPQDYSLDFHSLTRVLDFTALPLQSILPPSVLLLPRSKKPRNNHCLYDLRWSHDQGRRHRTRAMSTLETRPSQGLAPPAIGVKGRSKAATGLPHHTMSRRLLRNRTTSRAPSFRCQAENARIP